MRHVLFCGIVGPFRVVLGIERQRRLNHEMHVFRPSALWQFVLPLPIHVGNVIDVFRFGKFAITVVVPDVDGKGVWFRAP